MFQGFQTTTHWTKQRAALAGLLVAGLWLVQGPVSEARLDYLLSRYAVCGVRAAKRRKNLSYIAALLWPRGEAMHEQSKMERPDSRSHAIRTAHKAGPRNDSSRMSVSASPPGPFIPLRLRTYVLRTD
jgi:hypothetical protein